MRGVQPLSWYLFQSHDLHLELHYCSHLSKKPSPKNDNGEFLSEQSGNLLNKVFQQQVWNEHESFTSKTVRPRGWASLSWSMIRVRRPFPCTLMLERVCSLESTQYRRWVKRSIHGTGQDKKMGQTKVTLCGELCKWTCSYQGLFHWARQCYL